MTNASFPPQPAAPLNPGSLRPTRVRFRTLTWLTLAAALAYLSRNAVGVAESTIREDLGLTLQQSGWFMGAFFWTYAIFQVPTGYLAQRRGTRLALTLFALTWSLATLAVGIAPGFALLIVAQLMMGTAQAGVFPASCQSISRWMPLAGRALACGLVAAGMQIGAIASGALTGRLLEPIGWRWVFILYAAPGIVWAIWFGIRFRDHPGEDPRVNPSERALIRTGREDAPDDSGAAKHEPAPWLAIARHPSVWLLCAQQICRAAGYMFFASWFPTFLQETRGISVKDSGSLQALVLTGTFTGSVFGGLLTDWIWRRTRNLRFSRSGVGAAFLFGCAVLILAAWFVESVALAVALLAAGSLFAALAGPCAIAATIDIGDRHAPLVFGLMNMAGNFAAAACPAVVASLVAWTGNWSFALLLFAGVYLAGALCWGFVDSGRPLQTKV